MTAREELYVMKRSGGVTSIYSDRPVNWFERLPELRALGFSQFLIDSEAPEQRGGKIAVLLRAFEKGRAPFEPYSAFNFERRP